MQTYKYTIYLALAGIVLLTIGSYISFAPADYLTQFGMQNTGNTNFYSDLRAMGGSLAVFGFVSIWGALQKSAQKMALFTSAIVFSAYALFRFIAFMLDGTPGTVILGAAIIELVFAVIGWALFISNKLSTRTLSVQY